MFDLVIVGGGPVGVTAATALHARGINVLLIEAQPKGAADDRRALALSHGSGLILKRVGVPIERLPATPITTIHVSQRGGFGRVVMTASEVRLLALGHVVSYSALHAALREQLAADGVPTLYGARAVDIGGDAHHATVHYQQGDSRIGEIACRLVVLADGGVLAQRTADYSQHDYRQCALAASVSTDQPHANRAFERFAPGGPIALLPFGENYALVWTLPTEEAAMLSNIGEGKFLSRLQAQFGGRAGQFLSVGGRISFPLWLRHAPILRTPRTLLLGNAAQTLHPVAGQGLNLGLRDAFELARALDRGTPLEAGFVPHFMRQRKIDRAATVYSTDTLVQLFSRALPGLTWLRGCGLTALDSLPPAKHELMQRMMFGS